MRRAGARRRARRRRPGRLRRRGRRAPLPRRRRRRTRSCSWSTAAPSTAAPSTRCAPSSASAGRPTPRRAPRRRSCAGSWSAGRPQRLGVVADPNEVASRRAAMVDQARERAGADVVALQRVSDDRAQLRSGLADGVLREALAGLPSTDLARHRGGRRGRTTTLTARSFRTSASVHLWSIQVAAERIAQSALARLRRGRPFDEVARQFTTDPEAEGGRAATWASSR